MEVWYTLYSRKDPPCEWCEKARELLQLHGLNYHEVDLNDQGVRELFQEKGWRTVPRILEEQREIGGFTAFEHYIKEFTIEKEKEYRTRGNRKLDGYHTG